MTQSSENSALSNMMSEKFILSSPLIRDEMEEVNAEAIRNKSTAIQRAKSYLRCAKFLKTSLHVFLL